ncbi:TlpA family protein disulfide reductase [Halovulum dunhuangense]|uniref:TlpA family protein disulfide reductase n=1 Tax=Halovulum dunhuangense TaxID=1505036 RepID=A0A849KZI2_9RHOB|nr:TlpA disulfide reductase family protein [Halovulum dunhuangense]NNU79642.1 TlpA family protein disulfide reductase [Halovulum dunhuangense]
MTRPILTALLYASLVLTANPLAAAGLDPALKAELEALREGDMRKLVFTGDARDTDGITFQTAAGETRALSDSDGKVRIVNFWATWCAPCRQEKPALDALNKAMAGPDFEVIAIATGRNSLEGIARFNAEVGVESLTTYVDPASAAARAMGVLGLPVSIILDREGNEVARLAGGADWTSASTRAILDRLIAR